jgi:hypothetical protein
MTVFRWSPALSLLTPFVVADTAHAVPIDRQLFTWTGRVDREVVITMRGRDIRTSGPDAGLPNRARVESPLPQARGDVLVRLVDGRGSADVIEQPSARNGYITRIRIRDPRGGADSYRLTAYWAGDERFDDRRDRDRTRDRDDDRWDDRRGNNGRGEGWGRGGRRDGEPFPGRGNGNGRDDRNDRDNRNNTGRDDRNGRSQDSGTLRWSGRVDDVVEIRLTGQRVETITRSGARVSNVNHSVRGASLPQRDVQVSIERRSGRGEVRVVQQPSRRNGFTTVIRIFDPQGGASFYDVTAFW